MAPLAPRVSPATTLLSPPRRQAPTPPRPAARRRPTYAERGLCARYEAACSNRCTPPGSPTATMRARSPTVEAPRRHAQRLQNRRLPSGHKGRHHDIGATCCCWMRWNRSQPSPLRRLPWAATDAPRGVPMVRRGLLPRAAHLSSPSQERALRPPDDAGRLRGGAARAPRRRASPGRRGHGLGRTTRRPISTTNRGVSPRCRCPLREDRWIRRACRRPRRRKQLTRLSRRRSAAPCRSAQGRRRRRSSEARRAARNATSSAAPRRSPRSNAAGQRCALAAAPCPRCRHRMQRAPTPRDLLT
mmetsp:Transcript_88164/g.254427  ORF Transcript_88164/g.254427 Transcript_88164/m.254427 type:complete len:301 (+) Transcript_88164:1056-1958(+)